MIAFDESLLRACPPTALLPERRRIEAERLQLPLRLLAAQDLGLQRWFLVVQDQRGIRYGVPAVVEAGALRRAAPGDGVSEALVALAADPAAGVGDLKVERFAGSPQSGESAIEVDQTNELVRVGDAIVKWNLHPAEANAPGPVCSSLLHRAGFAQTPAPWAHVRLDVADEVLHIASVFQCIDDTEDGWDWAVADVREFARGETSLEIACEASRVLGAIVAGMHAGLAQGGVIQATEEHVRSWLISARSELEVAVELESQAGHLDLSSMRTRCLAIIDSIAAVDETPLIRIHGDLHIGQILRTRAPHAYYVIDFDGNPTQETNDPFQSAARDVASMLCSLDHVARVVIKRTDGLSEIERQRVMEWIPATESAFLDSYVDSLRDRGCSELFDSRLVPAFRVQQECREYIYADRYLPHWRYVPEAALPRLLAAPDLEEG